MPFWSRKQLALSSGSRKIRNSTKRTQKLTSILQVLLNLIVMTQQWPCHIVLRISLRQGLFRNHPSHDSLQRVICTWLSIKNFFLLGMREALVSHPRKNIRRLIMQFLIQSQTIKCSKLLQARMEMKILCSSQSKRQGLKNLILIKLPRYLATLLPFMEGTISSLS